MDIKALVRRSWEVCPICVAQKVGDSALGLEAEMFSPLLSTDSRATLPPRITLHPSTGQQLGDSCQPRRRCCEQGLGKAHARAGRG